MRRAASHGRNSDNTKIVQYLGWEPNTRLRDGMEKTYRWIYDEFTAKYTAKTAHKSLVSTFSHGVKPIPGDGYVGESRNMTTWRQGIPAGYGAPTKAAKPARKTAKSESKARHKSR